MKKILKIWLGISQITALLILGYGYSAVIYAEIFLQRDSVSFIDVDESIYSDTVAGSISLTPIIELVYMADVNCYESLSYEDPGFQLGPIEKVENYVPSSTKKSSYSASLYDVEKEAEIMFLETGFFLPSLITHEPVVTVDTVSDPIVQTSEQNTTSLIENSMAIMIKNLVFQSSGNKNCSVDNLNIQLINKLNLMSL
tara:strand:- start:51172 stop:51765 length:594 start_codon:yes stop_codon:yes gene_type:complete